MRDRLRFRATLPISQTAVALIFGGWGLWWRSQILSHSAFGWNSTMVYHVRPWPFRLALVLNVPAFLGGALVWWPIDKFASNLPEAVVCGGLLPFVFVLWYWIGRHWIVDGISLTRLRGSLCSFLHLYV